MINANIVLLGKTGTGKSTIVNALLGRDQALEGKGKSCTQENKTYSLAQQYNFSGGSSDWLEMKILDTVGLEIDAKITKKTLNDIKRYIEKASAESETDINIVWFCINQECSRFESFELDLINEMSIEYEIPFVVLLTQCRGENDELEREINATIPSIRTFNVVAKPIRIRNGFVIEPFGLDEALAFSIEEYDKYKVKLLNQKLLLLEQKDKFASDIRNDGEGIIQKYSRKARKAARFSVLGLPVILTYCKKMIFEINSLVGIVDKKRMTDEMISSIAAGIVLSLPMVVPIFGKMMAESYIESIGESYLEIVIKAYKESISIDDMKRRIISEIDRRNKK